MPSRFPVLALALALTPAFVFAATPGRDSENSEYAKALAISVRIAGDLQSYRIRAVMTMTTEGEDGTPGAQMEAAIVSAARWPDRLINKQTGSGFDVSLGVNKDQSWFHLGQMNTCYLGKPVTLARDRLAGSDTELTPEKIFNFYEGLGQTLLPAGLPVLPEVGQGTVRLGDRDVACRVFRTAQPASGAEGGAEGQGPQEYWFDPASGLVLKAVMTVSGQRAGRAMQQTITFRVDGFTLDGEVSDEEFAFAVPAGTRIVDHLDRLVNPDAMTGQLAPEITFRDFDGAEVKLSDFRGKVVFLDFWATWCGPCKMEMPHLQALHEEFGGAGQVVFLAASSEDPAAILPFIRKYGYTFKVVRVSADDAHQKYKASSIPAGFVIDREGVIRAHMVGAQSEQQLRRALAKAGIKG